MFWRKRSTLKEVKDTTEKAVEPKQRSKDTITGEIFHGMRLDVTAESGVHLLAGQVVEYGHDSLTLERPVGTLSFQIIALGTFVNLVGYDKRKFPISLRGVVKESSRVAFKVNRLQVDQHAENRNSFRLPISVPVSLYRQEDEHMQQPEECMLINISTGGCCVQSDYIHIEDEVVQIRLKLEDYAPMKFLGQIIRCTEHEHDQYWYGILFAQMTDHEVDTLTRTLYNLQVGDKNTHQRSEVGHW